MPTMKIIVVSDNVRKRADAIRAYTNSRLYVGVPEAKTERNGSDESSVTNATIGFFNEFGAPEAGIPARPHLVPGVKSVQRETITDLRSGMLAAMSGHKTTSLMYLNKIGLRCQNAVRGKIREGLQPELADSTIRGRQSRGRTGTKPLWDTGQYLRSITYVIKKLVGLI